VRDRFRGKKRRYMPKYFIQGKLSIDPPSPPDVVMFVLNRHGAGLTGSTADHGGAVFVVSETVDASSEDEGVAELASQIAAASERRDHIDNVRRFAVGPFVAEYVSTWLDDDELGNPQLGPPRRVPPR
jgi:hypothetical protein